jgi:DNA polymerase-1
MISVDQWLGESGVDARMIMQVHDELVLEVAESDVKKVSDSVREIMRSAATLVVPLEVEVGVGNNWQEAH